MKTADVAEGMVFCGRRVIGPVRAETPASTKRRLGVDTICEVCGREAFTRMQDLGKRRCPCHAHLARTVKNPPAIGARFGSWTVIGHAFREVRPATPSQVGKQHTLVMVPVRCACAHGTEKNALLSAMIEGTSRSCGRCSRAKYAPNLRHGDSGNKTTARLYRIWQGMKTRTGNPNQENYRYYGARGIEVCQDWMTYETFRAWAVAAGYRDDLTIDRVDPDGNYCPENCRWVTPSENSRRVRRAIA